jgi:hypothetical protein
MVFKRAWRGNTMAFYAMFLATVGLPLMAVTVDVSRAYLMNVRLRSATEAGCEAYANSLDVKAFKTSTNGELKFKNAIGNAYLAFHGSMPSSAGFTAYEVRQSGANSKIVEIKCTGFVALRPLVPLIRDYNISAASSAKTKFSTQPH